MSAMNGATQTIQNLPRVASALPGQWLYLLDDEEGVVYSETKNRFAGLSAAGVSAYRAFDAGASVEDLRALSNAATRHSASAKGMDTVAALVRGVFPAEDSLLELPPLQHPVTASIEIHDIPALIEFPRGPLEELCRDYFRNCAPSTKPAKCHVYTQRAESGWTIYVNCCGMLSSLADEQLGLGFLHAGRCLLYVESRYDVA